MVNEVSDLWSGDIISTQQRNVENDLVMSSVQINRKEVKSRLLKNLTSRKYNPIGLLYIYYIIYIYRLPPTEIVYSNLPVL